MSILIDRQTRADFFPTEEGYQFTHGGKSQQCSSVEKVYEFFQKSYDTVKLYQAEKKSYVHFFADQTKVLGSKKLLRKNLSHESGGAWIEEKSGKQKYFLDSSGWFGSSFKHVSKEEFHDRLGKSSATQKASVLVLSLLAFRPCISEFGSCNLFGAKEVVLGLSAIIQKSPQLVLVGTSLIMSSSGAQALGGEFLVGDYTSPDVTIWKNDLFLVVGKRYPYVFAKVFDYNGSQVGPELTVSTSPNADTVSSDLNPAVATIDNQGFVITWSHTNPNSAKVDIYGRIFDSNATAIGTEFQVSQNLSYVSDSSVSSFGEEKFAVVFTGRNISLEIYCQIYRNNGSTLGPQFQVNTYTTNFQIHPTVSGISSGGYVVGWQSRDQDRIPEEGVFAQRYDNNGMPLGSEFQVNNYTYRAQRFQDIAPLNEGKFVIVWESESQGEPGYHIFAQIYYSNGTIIEPEFQVSIFSGILTRRYPSVATLNGGGFVVTWIVENTDSIFGQRCAENGTRVGPEFQVSSMSGHPKVAGLENGGFVIVWAEGGRGTIGKIYDRDGIPIFDTPTPSPSPSQIQVSSSITTPGTTSSKNSKIFTSSTRLSDSRNSSIFETHYTNQSASTSVMNHPSTSMQRTTSSKKSAESHTLKFSNTERSGGLQTPLSSTRSSISTHTSEKSAKTSTAIFSSSTIPLVSDFVATKSMNLTSTDFPPSIERSEVDQDSHQGDNSEAVSKLVNGILPIILN